MHVRIVDNLAGVERLRSAWEAVYDADDEAQFFLSWQWQRGMMRRLDRAWRVLVACEEAASDRVVALLPLRVGVYRSKRHGVFCNELLMSGSSFWADYTGFLCVPGREAEAIPALAEALQQMSWAELELKHLLASPRRQELFLGAFDRQTFRIIDKPAGLNADGVDNDVCPGVALPESFEQYQEAKLSTNTRQKMRRFMRKVEQDAALRVTETSAETFERDMAVLLSFWRRAWASRKGDRVERMTHRFRDILGAAFEDGVLYMPMLWHDDRPLGVVASFVDRRKRAMLFKVAGRDERWKSPPPGLVLHGHSIRWAIEQGLRRYDFLRGNEAYKYSYGSEERHIRNVVIRTRTRRNLHEKLEPASVDEVASRAAAYVADGRLEDAATDCRQILDVRPDDAAVHRLLGQVQLRHRAFADAETSFRRAAALAGTLADHFCLGCALHHQGRQAEAVGELSRVAAAACDNAADRELQVKARQLLGQLDPSRVE